MSRQRVPPKKEAAIRAGWERILAYEEQVQRDLARHPEDAGVRSGACAIEVLKFVKSMQEPDLAAIIAGLTSVALQSMVDGVIFTDEGVRPSEEEVVRRISFVAMQLSEQLLRLARADPDLVEQEARAGLEDLAKQRGQREGEKAKWR